MKRLYFLLIFFGIVIGAIGQRVDSIRFVFAGEQLKPHGTLLISLGKYIMPTDMPLDYLFGLGIKTDEETFNFIVKYINDSKCTSSVQPNGVDEAYIIFFPKAKKSYLHDKNFETFFNKLSYELSERKLDPKIVNAFRHYHSGWRDS